jgi:dienelactone hydrolase
MNPRSNATAQARSLRLLLLSLALILFGDIGAYLVKTGGGSIDVTGIKLPTQNGQWIAADLFRPISATEQNPVPMVVVCPGFERSKEALDSYAIELARRGIAVVTIDPYAQGASSASRERRSATLEGYGVIPMVEYIASTPNFNYVDKSRIGAAGYSAGGNAVLQAASHFGGRKSKASTKARPKAQEGTAEPKQSTPSKLAAIFVGGYVLTLTDAVLAPIRSNVAMDYAFFDEGSFRNKNGNADMRTAPEALRLVNSAIEDDQAVSAVEIGRVYGDPKNRTMRVVYNTRNLHPFLPYDRESIGRMLDYFTGVFDLEPGLPSSSQTWLFKELFTLISLVGALMFLVPCATLLLRLPAFAVLSNPLPPPLPALTPRGRILFWTNFAVSALLACFLFIPMVNATFKIFPAASQAQQTWWFPQRINNAVLLWAVANGVIGLAVFWLTWKFHGRKTGVISGMFGIGTNVRELLRTVCLALCVLGSFYALLFASYAVFHVDFRFFFVSAAASFPPAMLLVALEYIPLFFVFYLANSIRVNSASRFEGQREWAGMLIMGLGNSVGLLLILAIQYASFVRTGTVFWTAEWLFANLLFGIIPMMFILPYFHRWFFRLTGKVYLGPMVTCFVFVMMMLTNNVCYIPLP